MDEKLCVIVAPEDETSVEVEAPITNSESFDQQKSKIKSYANEFSINENGEDGEDGEEGGSGEKGLKVRLDKWLWAARFFKTRALARAAVEDGKVCYNGARAKPSVEINIGDLLQIKQGCFQKVVVIQGLSTRRRSSDEANSLFSELGSEYSNFAQHGHGQGQNFYNRTASKKPKKSVRFLRRAFVRGSSNANISENEFSKQYNADAHTDDNYEYNNYEYSDSD